MDTFKRLLVGMALCIPSFFGYSQQQAMFTQYMFNNLALNPGYAGSHDALSATVLSRHQWIGIDGAPNTQTFSLHSPVPGRPVGLGLQFSRDQIGISKESSLTLSYAYKVRLATGKLSMGLQGGFSSFRHDFSELGIDFDRQFSGSENLTLPNVGAGLFYSSERFYSGLSAPYLLNRDLANSNTDLNTRQIRHYYLQAGYVFDLNHDLKLKPHLLGKVVEGAPVEIDINANLIIQDKFWIGASYRSFDSFDILLELQVNDQLRVGYAYDYTISDLKKVTTGSHEIMLQYLFVFSRDKVVTPRYF